MPTAHRPHRILRASLVLLLATAAIGPLTSAADPVAGGRRAQRPHGGGHHDRPLPTAHRRCSMWPDPRAGRSARSVARDHAGRVRAVPPGRRRASLARDDRRGRRGPGIRHHRVPLLVPAAVPAAHGASRAAPHGPPRHGAFERCALPGVAAVDQAGPRGDVGGRGAALCGPARADGRALRLRLRRRRSRHPPRAARHRWDRPLRRFVRDVLRTDVRRAPSGAGGHPHARRGLSHRGVGWMVA